MRNSIAVAVAVAGCVSPPLESPTPKNDCQPVLEFNQTIKNKVDVLFLVDNSASMQAMSDQLQQRFQEFLKVFDDLATKGTYADLHVGVVTSDYGAGSGNNACGASPGGQLGKLQAVGKFAPAGCKAPLGANYVSFQYTADGTDPNNLPPGQSLDQTFTCMASVGAHGCGYEHQLEAVYAALHNNLPDNAGFLRDDALLAVVFLTNEDDASAPPDSDVFDNSKTAEYGLADSYARQTRFAIVCCPPGASGCAEADKVFPPYGASGGPMNGCEPAPVPPGKMYPVSRYIDLFTKPAAQGGLKADPRDVILVGIDGPEDPFQVVLSGPNQGDQQYYPDCPQLNDSANPPCTPVLQHSCVGNPPAFFADPAIRVNTVVRTAKQHAISSICDSDFTGALQTVAGQIVSAITPGCLPFVVDDHPDCVVEDVSIDNLGQTVTSEIPSCDAAAGAFPCWKVDTMDTCAAVSPNKQSIVIDRNGAPAPAHTIARITCGVGC